MRKNKTYYSSYEDKYNGNDCCKTDLPELTEVQQSMGFSRRSFLKLAGFSFGAFMVACSKTPVQKAIPFLIQPEEVLPGKATWYASTSFACSSGCAVHVKNRDGRPIKLEGNPHHPLTQGGLCSQCQASLLELYDSTRIFNPMLNQKKSNWEKVDAFVEGKLKEVQSKGKEIAILTGSVTSPSLLHTIQEFKKRYKRVTHIQWDEFSYSAILDAHESNYGRRIMPAYKFDKAEYILSFDADFLGSWLSPVQFTKDFRKMRNLEMQQISKLVQVESPLSITGAKADDRIPLTPSEIAALIRDVDKLLQNKSVHNPQAHKLVHQLKLYKGKSIVVCGMNDFHLQLAVNRINHVLGNVNQTIDIKTPSKQYTGSDRELQALIKRLHQGKTGALLIDGVNPVYALPNGKEFELLMGKTDLAVSFSFKKNETTKSCHVIAPGLHDMESWNDSELSAGILSMTQPVLNALGENRSLRKSLAVWSGKNGTERELVKAYWKSMYARRKKGGKNFTNFWNNWVHDGYSFVKPDTLKLRSFSDVNPNINIPKTNGIELVLFTSSHLGFGMHAENPWLQELPDPITKVTWDNTACISPETAKKLGVIKGDVILLSNGNVSAELPVLIQPGQKNNTIAASLGYGRLGTERFHSIGPDWLQKKPTVKEGDTVGTSLSGLIAYDNGFHFTGMPVKVQKTGKKWDIAMTQTYHSLKNPQETSPAIMPERPFIQESTFDEYKKDPSAGSHHGHPVTTLWSDDHTYKGHHWGMAVDLSACTGCSACVVSCQVENNIPVVGKDEVLRKRDMAWLRLDRYYSGEGENVDVAFQTMMCQHCDNAPCEPVCPVLATVHSSEGLNQQVYNR
ncbi:MAG: 4Fe-4S dicluster domain-containing protein, partial [Candidatus Marinimicrobia bacterium]|nr:4Fe-4S dicluster domain-containing protein [Candidatus Neomarinimicrobiota bacterium]